MENCFKESIKLIAFSFWPTLPVSIFYEPDLSERPNLPSSCSASCPYRCCLSQTLLSYSGKGQIMKNNCQKMSASFCFVQNPENYLCLGCDQRSHKTRKLLVTTENTLLKKKTVKNIKNSGGKTMTWKKMHHDFSRYCMASKLHT